MYYKQVDNIITCISSDDKIIIQYTPNDLSVYDDSIPWIYTDKVLVRLKDCSKFVFKDDSQYLESLKQDKQNELNNAFNRTVEGSFITTEGYKMQFNTDDSLKMFGAIQLLESSGVESGYITDADDITHYDIPLAVMKSVQNQMLNKYAQCHLLKQQYRALIEAASDQEALEDIEFEF